jgi:hypothetical protein
MLFVFLGKELEGLNLHWGVKLPKILKKKQTATTRG